MSIQNVLNAAIYSRLTGGTALTALLTSGTAIYFKQAPDHSEDSDFVIFDYGSEVDLSFSPGREKDVLVLAKGISTKPAAAGSIDFQIDALLNDQALTLSGWSNRWIRRETGISYPEVDEAKRKWYHAGAYYRITLQKEN